jgi:hypothetical protein
MPTIYDLEVHSLLKNTKIRLREEYGWNESFVDGAVTEYFRFLDLHQSHPTVDLVPGKVVDKVWHDHILHTKKYSDFCEYYFGSYFHHEPKDRKSNKVIDIGTTCELYLARYGHPVPNQYWLDDEHVKCRICRYNDDPMKYFTSTSIRYTESKQTKLPDTESKVVTLTRITPGCGVWECG